MHVKEVASRVQELKNGAKMNKLEAKYGMWHWISWDGQGRGASVNPKERKSSGSFALAPKPEYPETQGSVGRRIRSFNSRHRAKITKRQTDSDTNNTAAEPSIEALRKN